jgi:hypothetical protein
MDQWSREPACQSGPDVAAYPVLLPPTLGEQVEQNVSLATSSDARLRRPVRVTVLRRGDVCAMEPGPAPRKHAPPQVVYPWRLMGVWGFYRATWSIPGRIFGAVHHSCPKRRTDTGFARDGVSARTLRATAMTGTDPAVRSARRIWGGRGGRGGHSELSQQVGQDGQGGPVRHHLPCRVSVEGCPAPEERTPGPMWWRS